MIKSLIHNHTVFEICNYIKILIFLQKTRDRYALYKARTRIRGNALHDEGGHHGGAHGGHHSASGGHAHGGSSHGAGYG